MVISRRQAAEALGVGERGDPDQVLPAVHGNLAGHDERALVVAMVLLDQIIQVLRRPQFRLGGQQAIGFQLTHRAVRRGIAVQSDRPGSIVLAFDRLPKKRLGGRDIALGAQPEVNRPPRPIHGTIEIAPFASNFDVCLVHPP
jgi:hypothetical protein